MADRALRKCSTPGCRTLHRNAGPKCDQHASERQPWSRDDRPSSTQRGYDRHWSRVRRQKLGVDPLCEDCLQQGVTRAAEEVHHTLKVSEHPDARLDIDTLLSLCKACHSRRTARGE